MAIPSPSTGYGYSQSQYRVWLFYPVPVPGLAILPCPSTGSGVSRTSTGSGVSRTSTGSGVPVFKAWQWCLGVLADLRYLTFLAGFSRFPDPIMLGFPLYTRVCCPAA